MRIAVSVVLSAEDRSLLERLSRGRTVAVRVVERAKIILLAAEGKQNQEIAKICRTSRRTVGVWRRPHFKLHFTPISASWLNMVERFFRDLTQNGLRRGVFRSVGDLITAVEEYLACHNQDPKPFIWTKAPATSSRRSPGRVRLWLREHQPDPLH